MSGNLAVAVMVAVTLTMAARCAAAEPESDPRAGAWDRSVAAERRGDLAAARAALTAAYGEAPESYEVAVRLAYLALKLRRAGEAIARYRRAAALPGAGPEAQEGLASALALAGYGALDRGERTAARARFTEALTVAPADADARRGLDLAGPPATLAPELWLGYLAESLGPARSASLAAFVQAPWQVSDRFSLRLAYRHLEPLASSGPGPWSPGGGRGPGNLGGAELLARQDEAYAAVRYERPRVAVEAMALMLLPQSSSAIAGPAGTLRLGRDYGVAVEGAGLARSGGWNGQVAPTAFYWPTPHFGVSAGARLTWDPAGAAQSALVGATVRARGLTLDLSGHYGRERWPVSVAPAAVLSITGDAAYGGALGASLRLSRTVAIGLSGQLERVQDPPGATAARGTYYSVALGLRLTPDLTKETP